jgi:rubredoxin
VSDVWLFKSSETPVPLLHLHRQYERRCKSCGYVWTVSRAEASMHKPNLGTAMRDTEGEGIVEGSGGRFDDAEAEFESQLETYDAVRQCPQCGLDDFEETAVRESTRSTEA